ncbi:MAG: alkaline phosphatase PhoX, partial [Iamia sp.]
MTTRGTDIDRRRVLRLMGAGLASSAMAPWLVACSSDSDAGPASTSGATSTTSAPTTTTVPPGPLGELAAPDANGLRLPDGFTSRVVATSLEPVADTGYTWHGNPDGGATFAVDGGGWVYVSNSEELNTGGVSMVRFDADGEIVEAMRILEGSDVNCAGGATPWDTWFSCEEIPGGRVWECDPFGEEEAVERPAMGLFKHEAVAVDPEAEVMYLSEDEPDGALYRFTPTSWPDADAGTLEVLAGPEGDRRWAEVPDPAGGAEDPTRNQVEDVVRFNGGEGLAHFEGTTYLSTKGDNRIWALDGDDVTVVYDAATTEATEDGEGVLTGVDNITVDAGGDRYVAEDGGNMQIVRLGSDDIIEPVVQVDG